MAQSVFHNRPNVKVVFSLINRSSHVPLAKLIDEGELRAQLDYIRTLRLSRGESTWLRGNMFYGKRSMFQPDFMEWFENLTLPPYHLERVGDQYELSFEGDWPAVMLWEIPALSVLMELRSRAVLHTMEKFELQVLYARGDDQAVGEGRAPAGHWRCNDRGFRHPPPSLLSLARLVRAGDAGGAWQQFHRHIQLPYRHATGSLRPSEPMPMSCPWSTQR